MTYQQLIQGFALWMLKKKGEEGESKNKKAQ